MENIFQLPCLHGFIKLTMINFISQLLWAWFSRENRLIKSLNYDTQLICVCCMEVLEKK